MSRSDRVVLAADWQWGDRYLRAGLPGSVLDRDGFGRVVVMLDCFTADSAPQLIDAELLRPAWPDPADDVHRPAPWPTS